MFVDRERKKHIANVHVTLEKALKMKVTNNKQLWIFFADKLNLDRQ